MFYEAEPRRLRRQVESCFAAAAPPDARRKIIGAVVPHAGLMYSGAVAACVYAAAEIPRRVILLGPNHTGRGHTAAIESSGAWRTPMGDVPIDEELAAALKSAAPMLEEDHRAHDREHSIEVQLPLLQAVREDFAFVPICLSVPTLERCEEIGRAIASVVLSSKEPVAIFASSDFNHYESQQITLRKDREAIEPILALEPESLWRTVRDSDISMCGSIPTTTMLAAAKALGATEGELLRHATSGEVSGDYAAVVGYAAILIS
jgi:MEMO1 family protein